MNDGMISKLCNKCGHRTSASADKWQVLVKMFGGQECYTCWNRERKTLIIGNLSSFTPKELAKMIKLGHISMKEIETGQVE